MRKSKVLSRFYAGKAKFFHHTMREKQNSFITPCVKYNILSSHYAGKAKFFRHTMREKQSSYTILCGKAKFFHDPVRDFFSLLKSWLTEKFITIKTSWNTND
jgi:hypothetical protein